MYEKLLAVLRHCGNENVPCEGCPVHDECGYFDIGAARNMREAADAIEELQQTAEHYKGCSDDWYKEACDYKAMLPRWIPVTERLPEEYVDVLCYCSRNGQYGCGEWCKEDNGTIYWIGLNGMIPTHWMELPKPPKEEAK